MSGSAPFRSYGQHFEDLYLRRALHDVERGLYVDLGAQDPRLDSVSLAFHEAGWRGVHVDPAPGYAERLRAARPGDLVLACAVTDAPGPIPFIEIPGGGLSTGDPALAARHAAAGWTTRRIEVETRPLSAILAEACGADPATPIHWLKIDVEGMETEAIRSWGDAPQRPWIVLVEATEPNSRTPSHAGWEPMLFERGYAFVWFDGLNRWYVHARQAIRAAAFGPGPTIFDNAVLESGRTGAELARLRALAARGPDVATSQEAPMTPLRLTADAVMRAYRLALGRDPESVAMIREQQERFDDYDALVAFLLGSPEAAARFGGGGPARRPAYYAFDPAPLFARYAAPDPQPRPGAIVNFLGVATDLRYADWASEGVEGPPVPGNFHATEAEWAAVLRAVDLAGDDMVVCELGAGWGCWMVNAAVAARARGAACRAIGVEGEPTRSSWIAAHAAANGLPADAVAFRHAVVGPVDGFAAFPADPAAATNAGLEPAFFETEAALDAFLAKRRARYVRTPCVTLDALFAAEPRVDLLHVDIQGGEASVIPAALDVLNRKVAYLFVGAHGRAIEGALIETMRGAGWALEVEEPCSHPMPLTDDKPYIDGAQGWRNPRLTGG